MGAGGVSGCGSCSKGYVHVKAAVSLLYRATNENHTNKNRSVCQVEPFFVKSLAYLAGLICVHDKQNHQRRSLCNRLFLPRPAGRKLQPGVKLALSGIINTALLSLTLTVFQYNSPEAFLWINFRYWEIVQRVSMSTSTLPR